MPFFKVVSPYMIIPRGYGVAYRRDKSDYTICAPIPFNFVIGWARGIWYRLVVGPRAEWASSLIKVQVEYEVAHAVHEAKLMQDIAVASSYAPFADGVNGHLERVKQVIRMVEMDLRAEIETQRDRITVLNRRVQMLEGNLPLDVLDVEITPIYRAIPSENPASNLFVRPGRFISVDGTAPPRDDNEVEPRS